MAEGSIFTFYSYKGGVGRTLALANIGALLCRWGYKVLCIDWDLEAPGLHLYYEKWIVAEQSPDLRSGLTELIQARVDNQSPNWRDFITEVRFPQINQPLSLMTAGRQDETYVQRMQALDWQRFYDEHQLGSFLETLRTEWKQEFDFILIDSRTGITDIGGICTVQLPDFLVVLFTANMQSLRGSLEVVRRAQKRQQSLPFDRARLLVLPVATRFEARIEYELAQEWLKTFATELSPVYADWTHKEVTASELLNFTRVPYIPYWSFGEKLPVIEKGTDDPDDIGFYFETLSALIAHKYSFSDVLVSNRDSFVTSAKSSNGKVHLSTDYQAKIYISFAGTDFSFVEELKIHLKPLERQGLLQVVEQHRLGSDMMFVDPASELLENSDIIILLASPAYLASDYCFDKEMPAALQRAREGKAILLPVLAKPIDWKTTPLAQFQFLNLRPISNYPDRDEAWLQVIKGVRLALEELASKRPLYAG
jgi:cellulose biosynthesis protein BcsQ